uniref:Uncharacterized protein n=1 Tax=Anopheles culicifacies TaxID=139723 RepID=A0A182LYL3_9DIPT
MVGTIRAIQSRSKVATEKNEPVANATGGRSSRSPSSTRTVEPSAQSPPVRSSVNTVVNGAVGGPPASPSEPASSPSQTVLPDGPTVMAGPTATAPVLTWSPLLFPPWNTALLPAAFYPVAALRSLPGGRSCSPIGKRSNRSITLHGQDLVNLRGL